LIGSTLADELRLATGGRSRIVSLGLKDRSAIMLGGHKPNAALWFDDRTGAFVSSSYYGPSLPAWATAFNERKPADAYATSTWEPSLAESAYATCDADDAEGEGAPLGSRTFPYRPAPNGVPAGGYYGNLLSTPYSNDLLFELAREAVTAERLGADDDPDFLGVCLSANDIVGHSFGPYSREVADMTYRTDRAIGDFFKFLDERVGKGNYLAVLSADHGIAPTPAHAKFVGGRYARLDDVTEPIDTALTERFGGGPKWVASASEGTSGGVFFDPAVVATAKADVSDLQRVAARAAARVPGVRFAIAGSDLAEGKYDRADQMQSRLAAGYISGRSPDVIVIFEPFAVLLGGPAGTNHGTPYSYDSHVPLLFYGTGVPAAYHTERVAVTDLAATVAALLRITPPSGCSGRPLLNGGMDTRSSN